MSHFLYEKSLSYKGHLIIPFVFTKVGGEIIYSYALLSERSYKGEFHKAKNPSGLCYNTLEGILEIAQEHLDKQVEVRSNEDYFEARYTYQNHLIIIHQEAKKCFYDHYPPKELSNIAAPILFADAGDCLGWIKERLERDRLGSVESHQIYDLL